MFRKILIANRGEIACRVLRTARRLRVATVAVYSEADQRALHVRMADQAIAIGPPPARESYLDATRIIAAAQASGAEAIHPGYGFLSENADFAEACAAAGIVFIGPPAAAIRAMGSKSAAKTLMQAAGVPVTPGYHGERQEPAFLREQASRIGYPVLIKASAGGGGRGMRRVQSEQDFDTALAACRREASAAFGDDAVLVERWVNSPRHIEVQVFGDRHGGCVHLFERDCSVQRRHQKVLEEAPAPGLAPQRRAAMGAAAVAAARAVGYVGAGTVEFIVERGGEFHFMEMNTRLQVEHPVTEMVTGVDLVEWQLRVAAGEPLPLAQEQLRIDGHSLEARIYAEDPEREFAPSSGRLLHLAMPAESPGVRVDSGVSEGDEVTPWYDPMLAKLVVWDSNRERARARMLQALAECRVIGVATNLGFLSRLVGCAAFAAAELDTGLVERERDFLFETGVEPPREAFVAATLAILLAEDAEATRTASRHPQPCSPWHARDGWRLNTPGGRRVLLRLGERETVVAVEHLGGGYRLDLDGASIHALAEAEDDHGLRMVLDGVRLHATVVCAGPQLHVLLHGRVWLLSRIDPLAHAGVADSREGSLLAPMPGTVGAWLVEPGAAVATGTPLMILEAMKMEHAVKAPAAGHVTRFRFAPGETVSEGDELLEFALETLD